jgi:hypothetical protein
LFGKPIEAFRAGVAAMKGGERPMQISDEFAAGELAAGQVEKHAYENAGDIIAIFEPHRLSERLAVQQGTFLWPGRVDRTIIELLNDFGDLTNGVAQIIVPCSERGRAMDQLRLMNITRASLFPGLDGFANSFRYLAVREPPQSRKLRMAVLGLERGGRPDGEQ